MQLHVLLSLFISFIPPFIGCHSLHPQPSSRLSQDDGWTEWLNYMRETSDGSASKNWSLSSDQLVLFTDSACLSSTNASDSTPGSRPWRRIIVAQNGSGDFTTIQKAVDSIPKYNQIQILICIRAGEYREKVTIPTDKKFITFFGETTGNGSIVVWNDTASTRDPKSGLPLKTFHSATVEINSSFFVAKYITFKNDAPPAQPGYNGGQAVAFRVTADYVALYSCNFIGYQDTLYDHRGLHYFKDCFIQGSIDFIFGNGRSLYKDCYLYALSAGQSAGYVTAQKRSKPSMNSGFSFLQCNLTGNGSVYLGRAWGKDSRVVFAYTWMDKIVVPEVWNDWGIRGRERTVFYAEYNCTGPGANSSMRVPWARQLTALEAQPFLSIRFINGDSWLQEV